MGLGLLAPWALLALASLAVPLLLHLHRRIQRTPLRFAALRWLRPLQRPRRRLRLERPWLLLLRLLLATLLVLLLAEPVWRDERPGSAWALLHPGLDPNLLPSGHASQARWWAGGFPTLDQPPPALDQPFASLLRQFDAERPADAPLQVWVPAELSGLDGTRLRLQRQVDWRVVESALARSIEPAAASNTDGESSWLIWRATDSPAGAVFLVAAARALAGPTDAPDSTRGDADAVTVSDRRPIELRSLAAPDDFNRIEPTTTVLLWLDQSPWPAVVESWLRAGGRVYWPQPCAECSHTDGWWRVWQSDDAARTLWARRVGSGRLLRPSVALQAAEFPELLDGGFPRLLTHWLDEPRPQARRAPASAIEPLGDGPPGRVPPRELQSWLLPLLALLLLGERLFALGPVPRPDRSTIADADATGRSPP